ncbi:hypothetical protein C2R22_21430 (plasmid) [Salinigranum rubrum]|uniref:Sulfatase N-terminal domain-containing protein n=1 Tax=Salinigranum rubrum TaxID=755307 RepID=A0A2I8VQG1_9EURY|nr:hypothetical protein C2R22_21430 [Salinigranum rubrum]
MPPNIVWLTLESLRFDHTSLSGYKRDTTPFLQSIAAESSAVSFDKCFSHGIWTRPASASILTGTYPSHHQAGMGSDVIPDDLPTVPSCSVNASTRPRGCPRSHTWGRRPGWTEASISFNTSSAIHSAKQFIQRI